MDDNYIDIKLFKSYSYRGPLFLEDNPDDKNNYNRKNFEFKYIKNIDSIKQSILVRILTEKGKLAKLGHEEYGIGVYNILNNSKIPEKLAGEIEIELQKDPLIQQSKVDVNFINLEELKIKIELKLINNEVISWEIKI